VSPGARSLQQIRPSYAFRRPSPVSAPSFAPVRQAGIVGQQIPNSQVSQERIMIRRCPRASWARKSVCPTSPIGGFGVVGFRWKDYLSGQQASARSFSAKVDARPTSRTSAQRQPAATVQTEMPEHLCVVFQMHPYAEPGKRHTAPTRRREAQTFFPFRDSLLRRCGPPRASLAASFVESHKSGQPV